MQRQEHQQHQEKTTYEHFNQKEAFFDRKVDLITSGLQPRFGKYLRDSSLVSKNNAVVICDYVLAMNTEINPSNNYRQTTIQLLIQISKFVSKSFNLMTRDDIIGFLDNLRKPESLDPLHKWIGTYNLYNVQLTRFFRWLYSPGIKPEKRQKPTVIELWFRNYAPTRDRPKLTILFMCI